MGVGREGLIVLVGPLLVRAINPVDKNPSWIPILATDLKMFAALEDQDRLASPRQSLGKASAPGAGTDDQNVIMRHSRLVRH